MNETRAGLQNEELSPEPQRFVILGTQRTGTILLMGLLDSHPEIACIGELFQHRADYVQHSVPRYRLYVTSSPKNRLLDLVARRSLTQSYLDSVFVTLDTPVAGFKLMLDQARRYPQVLNYLKRNGFRIIHIVRENPLRTHISRLRARKTRVYVSAGPVDRIKVRVDVDSLPEDLAALSNDSTALTNLLLGLELRLFSTSYEKLAGEGRQAELEKILSFLGMDATVELKPRSVKLTPDDLTQVVENYDEMASALRHTAYESYLD